MPESMNLKGSLGVSGCTPLYPRYIIIIIMKHKVAISGSFSGPNAEHLFEHIPNKGILQMALVGREITLQVLSENLDDVKKSLKNFGVNNITTLEWRKVGMTLSNSGRGEDDKKSLSVSLIPSALGEGLRMLAFVCQFDVGNSAIKEIEASVLDVISNAGITDAIYIVEIKKQIKGTDYVDLVRIATLNAIFNAGGIEAIESM